MGDEANQTTASVQNPQSQTVASHDHSVSARLRAERRRSLNNSEFILRSYAILGNSAEVGWFLLFTLIFPITMIIVGSLKLEMCPVQSKIPVWMVVLGATSTLVQTLNAARNIYMNKQTRIVTIEDRTGRGSAMTVTSHGFPAFLADSFNAALGLFIFIWFLFGNIWVFEVFDKVDLERENQLNYCDKLCYRFAFWSIIAVYIMIAVAILTGILFLIMLGIKDASNNDPRYNTVTPAPGPNVAQSIISLQSANHQT